MLVSFPPMGVYETLFKFLAASGQYMGSPGTHPWAQGYPLTTPVPGGPKLPSAISLTADDLKYPQAAGNEPLRRAIADYYRRFYDAGITYENVAIFAGGRPGIWATLAFLRPEVEVLVEETEYTPYFDVLRLLARAHRIVPSREENRFRPTLADYEITAQKLVHPFLLKSNPCNPTGVTVAGDALRKLVEWSATTGRGALFDEAYEFFADPKPVSALEFVGDIEATDIFVAGAATKGLQAPGIRVGWIVAAKRHIDQFRNWSSIGMGGVSRPSQIYALQLLELERVGHARRAIAEFFTSQRRRYAQGLAQLGLELYSGDGGFYHWARLPGGLTADALNERLFAERAAILPGTLCDMMRRGDASPLAKFVRFSFGPLGPESYESDLAILARCVKR
ncbi:MAG: aminotransferase class I/II-fold pyridoxal phosphate-dependent enzyme [Planctomycetota bacterium]